MQGHDSVAINSWLVPTPDICILVVILQFHLCTGSFGVYSQDMSSFNSISVLGSFGVYSQDILLGESLKYLSSVKVALKIPNVYIIEMMMLFERCIKWNHD